MKAGLSTSAALHVLVLGFAMVTLRAPSPIDVSDVQAMPVDIVPIEELTRLQQGDKTSKAKAEKPAAKPTKRQDPVPEARNAGDNEIDLEDVPKPEASPRKIETSAAPKAEPAPKPDPVPTEAKPEPKPEPKPAEAKPEPKPEPKPVETAEAKPAETKPDPVAEAIDQAEPVEKALELPDQIERPQPRPERQQEVAKVEEKKAEKPVEKTAKAPKQEDLESLLDETKALLNKQKPAGGGAKREEKTASVGADRPSSAQKLSVSEMDALRQRLGQCWSIPAGVDDAEVLKVSVRFRLDRSGELEGRPEVIKGGGASGPARTAAESAVRAVSKCAPFNLPADKYETWAEVVVNFDPSDMLF